MTKVEKKVQILSPDIVSHQKKWLLVKFNDMAILPLSLLTSKVIKLKELYNNAENVVQ